MRHKLPYKTYFEQPRFPPVTGRARRAAAGRREATRAFGIKRSFIRSGRGYLLARSVSASSVAAAVSRIGY
jgi:hypothetical protein